MVWLLCLPAQAGDYADSAHGCPSAGVQRQAMASAGYGRGNCGHCHEMHASLLGQQPAPDSGAPSAYALFSRPFNTAMASGPYQEEDNYCFACHNGFGSAQVVLNSDYSAVFGGAIQDTDSILATFNQRSYHNLADIRNFSLSQYSSWFNDSSNPCNSCHNPHLAKRNGVASLAGYPLLSAISKASDHFALWGENEVMASYSSYEAPYSTGSSREPGGVGDSDGNQTPDYVGFCTDCHSNSATIYSTTIYGGGRNLRTIDWSSAGEKHGGYSRDGSIEVREPYASAAATKGNFVLSCLDCHDPHGSSHIMLLRRRVNGENLPATISSSDDMGELCRRCHTDDLAASAGTNTANKWQYIHHFAPDAPYVNPNRPDMPPPGCSDCHSGAPTPGGQPKVACGNCHFHGGDDSWLSSGAGRTPTYRKTF